MRPKAFIGSTSRDLLEHREAVRIVVDALGYEPNMMEDWGAMDKTAVELCYGKVRESEVYIGIYAHRYGFSPEGSDISITEMEFEWATEMCIPRLCFLLDSSYTWSAEFIDEEPDKSKLDNFKNRIESFLIRALFTDKESLATAVNLALENLKTLVTWAKVQKVCDKLSSQHRNVIDETNLFVPRPALDEHITRFMVDESLRFLILSGKSGMGKTQFLADVQQRYNKGSVSCILQDSNSLLISSDENTKNPVFVEFSRELLPRLNDVHFGDLLNNLEQADDFDKDKTRLLIIVDAINELTNMTEILQTLSAMRTRDWVKIIISCRPHVHAKVLQGLSTNTSVNKRAIYQTQTGEWFVDIPLFSQEELTQAYAQYQQVFQFEPKDIRLLDKGIRKILSEPLMLSLVAQICKKRVITSKEVGSDITIIPRFVETMLTEKLVTEDYIGMYQDFLGIDLPQLMVLENTNQEGV